MCECHDVVVCSGGEYWKAGASQILKRILYLLVQTLQDHSAAFLGVFSWARWFLWTLRLLHEVRTNISLPFKVCNIPELAMAEVVQVIPQPQRELEDKCSYSSRRIKFGYRVSSIAIYIIN